MNSLITRSILPLTLLFFTVGCGGQKSESREADVAKTDDKAEGATDNQLTEAEKAEGWRLLFDGKTLNGWHKYNADTIGKKWKVEDGALFFGGDEENEDASQAAEGGDIVTDDEFANYELSLEWKISPGGNSGIIYNVIESEEYKNVWSTGLEMQVLDNEAHPDGQFETHRAGDLYDLIACSEETVNPAGEWNQIRLIVNNGNIKHWMNGVKVVETQLWTAEWDSLIAGSKFAEMPGYGAAKKGRIALQDHNDPVWYKNIKLKEL